MPSIHLSLTRSRRLIAVALVFAILIKLAIMFQNKRKQKQEQKQQANATDNQSSPSDFLIRTLQLIAPPDGGYFRTVYKSGCDHPMRSKGRTDTGGLIVELRLPSTSTSRKLRNLMSCIFWLQRARDCRQMSLHCAGCDIIHFYHAGCGLRFYICDPMKKTITMTVLGPRFERGHQLQLITAKHCWIAAELLLDEEHEEEEEEDEEGGEKYCLVSEACCPGFDFADWRFIHWREVLDVGFDDVDDTDILRARGLMMLMTRAHAERIDTNQYYN